MAERGRGTSATARESALRRLPWAAPFILLALVVAFDRLSSDQAWPVAALVLIGVVILIVPTEIWQKMIDRVEEAKFGPVSLGLRREVEDAAMYVPPSDKGEGVDEPTEGVRNIIDLRMRLEWKLVYVAKHLLAQGGEATYVTVGSLRFDGYLSDAEARTAIGILSTRDEELDDLSDTEREKFLDEAQEFVDSIRASVFWGQVRRVLGGQDGDAEDLIRKEIPSSGSRRDLLAGADGKECRVVPTLALKADSRILQRAEDRLAGEGGASPEPERQVIAIPDISEAEPRLEGNPKIVKLSDLRSQLEVP